MKTAMLAIVAILVMAALTAPVYGATDEIDDKRLEVYLEKDKYLTNEVLVAYYAAYNITTGELLSGSGHWEIWEQGPWWDPFRTLMAEGNFTAPSGTLEISLPAYNISAGDYWLRVFYNVSGDVLNVDLGFTVEQVQVDVNVDAMEGGFYPSSYVRVRIYSNAIGSPVGPIIVYREDAPDQWTDIDIYSSDDLGLIISQEGYADWFYKLPNENPGTRIMFEVKVMGETGQEIITLEEKVTYALYLSLNKESYIPGETLVAEVMAEGTYPSGDLIYHWTISYQELWSEKVIYYNVTDSKKISYDLPTWLSDGWVHVYVDIYKDGDLLKSISTYATVETDYGSLYVIPDRNTFTGSGDVITLWFILDSEYITNPSYLVVVEGLKNGDTIWTGTYETTNSVFQFQTPDINATDYHITVIAMEAGMTITGDVWIEKSVGTLTVIPDKTEFMSSGETISLSVILDADAVMTNPTYTYTLTYYIGNAPVYTTEYTTTSTTYEFTIPTEEPYKWADRVVVEVVAEQGDLAVSGTTEIVRVTQPRLTAQLITESEMINDVFVPGQNIVIMYELEIPEVKEPDQVYILYYSFDGDRDNEKMVIIDISEGTTGTLVITIPEDTVTGGHYVSLTLYSATGTPIDWDGVWFTVDSTPQWSQGIIAGMSADMFLLTVLVAVLLMLVAFNTFKPYLGGRMPREKPVKERIPKISRGKKMAPQEFQPAEEPAEPPEGEEFEEEEL